MYITKTNRLTERTTVVGKKTLPPGIDNSLNYRRIDNDDTRAEDLNLIVSSIYLTLEEAFSPDSMNCTRGCNYSFT